MLSLKSDIRERKKKYERRMQTSVNNTVNGLRYEIKFENIRNVRNIAFFLNENIFYSWTHISSSFLILLTFFLLR